MDGLRNKIFPVAMRLGDTPVLIPNTMVKTLAADDTTLETMWESRWLPESFQKQSRKAFKYRRSIRKDVQIRWIYQ